VRIVAGEFSENGRAENYSIPSGDKTFFGMDWELWQHLLPENGATLANNPAGQNGQKRAAQHQWHTISFAGGRGNNTFNLGNITDNITNNGLFYSGDASYKISLTHDDYYTPQEILDEGIKFGNVYSSGDEQEAPYVSTVNLNLQAEPNSYSVMVQTADPGEKGNDFFKNVLPWTGAVGYAQKLVKTPLDVNKDYFENWKKKEDIFKEKEGKITITDWRRANGGGLLIKDKEEFEAGYKFLESIPSGQKWWDKPSLKVTKLLFGQVFPWVDLASGAISTVKGLIEFFSSKEAAPPRQEISTTFKEQGLSTGRKAVLINDWNPYTKINLNLPSFSPSDWAALSLSVNKPDTVSSGNNTNKGAYLELTHTSLVNSKTSQVDHPLVILENLDKNDRVDKVQKDGGGFGYYTYSFVDPDGNSGGLIGGEFNPIRSSSLRLFGQLANPKKLIGDDGSSIEAITFPAGFEYRSENNFDMRNDAENYSSFASVDSSQRANHYSRYYMGIDPGVKDRPEWSMAANLSPYTSNVSLEFDSRTHGWYWQPVLKTVTLADGSLDAATMLNPSTQDMDYDASKLWVNDPNEGWISFSFSQLDTNITAYRYSKLATTFYATSTDKDKDGISDGQEEINKRNKLNRQLLLLEGYAESLPEIDQRLLSEELKLYSITQIESVKKITDFQYDGGVSEEACLIVFNSANEKGEQVKRRLVLHRVGDQLMPAVAVDSDLRPVTPTDFTFNVIVDPSNPTQRPVYNPSQQNPELMVRYFAGFYDPETDKTQLFEYVATPKEDIDGLSFEEARQLARNRQLPQSIKLDEGIVSHLATIESPAENDSITGWFQGNAWLAADNQADRDIWSFKDVWHWVEGKSTGLKFWYKELGKEGPIDNRYSNWEFGEPKLSYDQGLAVNGDTGKWLGAVKTAPIGEGVTGYLVEYTPFQGLPSLE
jgi:hypothetical protein